ncbi:Phytoene synthase/Lycopene cyclase [Diplogelasinospora grovesii]|uniref:Bifunctional lycopene cyclase/phytoene synthase n=1 Tax=Diplogelasinospora grovesii TaxID=303347 RepID=A0AAN6S5H4_9PEZI|nr:Phytoene synthase/Lycopene cyclase [Diplogelasinospora grovesii]
MAYEYAWVHVKFTIPLALLLSVVSYPILNRVHFFQVGSIVVVAFVATLPWDAYLIRRGVWTYPPDAVIGPCLLGVPAEELFFFVVQTYITSLVYILFSKPLLHVVYLQNQRNPPRWIKQAKLAGQLLLGALVLLGERLVRRGGSGTYLGLILVWAPVFALVTWTVAGRFILSLPWPATTLPILLPTVFLWLVDELALGRGTWSIESGTKLGLCLFGALDIEEATFFLVTNTLIVFGMATFDQYLAVIYAFPDLFPTTPRAPTPLMLVQSRLADPSTYDMERVDGIIDAVNWLERKSRSFYMASAAFSGRLRIDLILLYSFCRVADDLVDDHTSSEDEVCAWTSKLGRFLRLRYGQKDIPHDEIGTKDAVLPWPAEIDTYVNGNFPSFARPALKYLPTNLLPCGPLLSLLRGFEMDAKFDVSDQKGVTKFPIENEHALRRYAECVAGTVGELCVSLIIHHCEPDMDEDRMSKLKSAANTMGIALQYVNIARDVEVDAAVGRVYLPTTWLGFEGLTPEMVLKNPSRLAVERLRWLLLRKALELYSGARPAMQLLPSAARGPMIAAVETYMEIGRVMLERDAFQQNQGRATVPTARRLSTALRALVLC